MLSKEEIEVLKGQYADEQKWAADPNDVRKLLSTIETLQKEVERKNGLLTEILETTGRLEMWAQVKIRQELGI
jgi:hypothetical protein